MAARMVRRWQRQQQSSHHLGGERTFSGSTFCEFSRQEPNVNTDTDDVQARDDFNTTSGLWATAAHGARLINIDWIAEFHPWFVCRSTSSAYLILRLRSTQRLRQSQSLVHSLIRINSVDMRIRLRPQMRDSWRQRHSLVVQHVDANSFRRWISEELKFTHLLESQNWLSSILSMHIVLQQQVPQQYGRFGRLTVSHNFRHLFV